MSERNWKIVNTKWTDSRSAEFEELWDQDQARALHFLRTGEG